jgi:O-methyltransferase
MAKPDAPTGRTRRRRRALIFTPARVTRWYDTLSLPLVILFVLNDRQIHPAYGMTWRRRFELGWRIFKITRSVTTGTSYRALLAMASKILQFPRKEEGVVVEMGCWQGGSTAAFSVICEYAQRQLIVYDSFEGLPPVDPEDELANPAAVGAFRGALETVTHNVTTHGVIERCTFRKGWLADTVPHHTEPVILAYVDVDLQSSLHDAVVNIWPHLVTTGYLFIDEFLMPRYCALFWSERWWSRYLDCEPPGLLGSGSGIGLGQFFVGPNDGRFGRSRNRPYQAGTSVAYTRKDLSGAWSYFPDR